jgi:uncharacterized protein UPF0175
MNVTVEIPDDFAQRLKAAGGDLSRRALEAPALEEYKRGRLSKPELRRMVGFATRAELDEFLKSREVFGSYSPADLERDRNDLRRLGFYRRCGSLSLTPTAQLSDTRSADAGERMPIALASAIGADLILMDDRDGVAFARNQGKALR